MKDGFVYNSDEFDREIANSPHYAGEIAFLGSIAEPGITAVEAGANKGVTAIALAQAIGQTGHLYAFEPIPDYYSQLQSNLSLKGIANVTTYKLALNNQTGRIAFYKREGGGGGITHAEGGEMLWVEATTITEFLIVEEIHVFDLLNLDCEGSELLVLQGAQSALEKYTPKIFCEIHHDYLNELEQSVDDVISFLRQLDYDIRMLQVEDLKAKATKKTCSHIYATSARKTTGNE